jgi:acetylornithine deacetylase/succinyl-diaminopimelate desuccinylase-like protein
VTEFITNLKTITGEGIEFEIIKGEESASSKIHTEFSEVLSDVLKKPLIPMISPAMTDLRFLRKKGITSYGITPIVLTKEDLEMIHGNYEKISITNLIQGMEHTYEIVKKMCT